jgi:hypothetical protein
VLPVGTVFEVRLLGGPDLFHGLWLRPWTAVNAAISSSRRVWIIATRCENSAISASGTAAITNLVIPFLVTAPSQPTPRDWVSMSPKTTWWISERVSRLVRTTRLSKVRHSPTSSFPHHHVVVELRVTRAAVVVG